MQKPLSIARRDYMATIVKTTNESGLPAFVIVDILKDVLAQVQPLMDEELKRDEAQWRAAVQAEKSNAESELNDHGK